MKDTEEKPMKRPYLSELRQEQKLICEYCLHFEPYPNPNKFVGLCHFNPPAPFLWRDGEAMEDREAIWPVVEMDNWCGKFQSKED